jgi:hypothetical protein
MWQRHVTAPIDSEKNMTGLSHDILVFRTTAIANVFTRL